MEGKPPLRREKRQRGSGFESTHAIGQQPQGAVQANVRINALHGAGLLAALPEVLRHVAGPLQALTGGRLDASILRQLLIALAMIGIMLARPRGLWPSPNPEDRLIPDESIGGRA